MSFKGDLQKFAEKSKENLSIVTKKVLIDIGRRVVERTPVGDPTLWKSKYKPKGYAGGRARGSWQYGFNSPATAPLNSIDPSGEQTVARISGEIDPEPGVHFITSNLPYIQALEDGHSSQAPSGMVGLTAIEYKDIVDIAVREAKK